MKVSNDRKIYEFFSTIVLIILCSIMLLPILNLLAQSVSAKKFVDAGEVFLIPKGFTLSTYKYALSDIRLLRAYKNTIFITTVGTFINLVMTMLMAYPMSRKEFLFKKPLLLMVTISIIFAPPLIPRYLLVKAFNLDNTLWAVIIPGAISGFNFLVMRSFFVSIPGSLIDAARIDGCSEMNILVKIVAPISKPAMAAVGLFYGVGHWNALFGPLIYLRDPKLQTLQIRLSQIIMSNDTEIPDVEAFMHSSTSIKTVSIVLAVVPILVVYPYLQKYFVKGVTLGSVKE